MLVRRQSALRSYMLALDLSRERIYPHTSPLRCVQFLKPEDTVDRLSYECMLDSRVAAWEKQAAAAAVAASAIVSSKDYLVRLLHCYYSSASLSDCLAWRRCHVTRLDVFSFPV